VVEWNEYRLGHLCKIGRGSSPRPIDNPKYFVNGAIPWVKIADATSSGKRIYKTKEVVNEYGASFSRFLKKGSLILATSGVSLGQTKFLGVDACIHDGWLYFDEFSNKLAKGFLYYKLLLLGKYLHGQSYGAAIQNVNTGILKSTLLKIPPLPTQQKIANILSAYDDLIENNLKRIKLLEEMAQNTYEEWFIRLKFPGYENTKINNKTGLPEGWRYEKLGENIRFIKGKKVGEVYQNQLDGTKKVLLLDALENGNFSYTKIGMHIQTKRDDIMMLMDGARSSHVFYSENGIIGSTMAKIIIKKIPASLLYHYFKNIFDWLQINNTGAAIPHANKSFINNLLFMLPNVIVIDKWNKKIDVINNEIWNLKDSNKYLKEARDILLPRLMTGMIDVEKLETEL